jgi:hypothetical protein
VGKIVRCYGMGKIVGAAAGYDELFDKHIQSVRLLKFQGSIEREPVGSAGYEDPEGGPISGYGISVAGTISGLVFIPEDLFVDPTPHHGASGAASFLKRTLLEDEMPDEVDDALEGTQETTQRNVTIKAMKRSSRPDFYEVQAEVQIDAMSY